MLDPESGIEGQEGFLNCLGPMCFIFFYKMISQVCPQKETEERLRGKKKKKFLTHLGPRDTLAVVQEGGRRKEPQRAGSQAGGEPRERPCGQALYWGSEWRRQEKA